MTGRVLEVCVDDLAGLAAAVRGGADRIELCAALELGGLTPSAGRMRAGAMAGVPVHALIRPRAGGFVYGEDEVVAMCADIEAARAAGLAGVVIGAARPDGSLDRDALARMAEAADGMAVTLNRVIDLVPDWQAALEAAVELGLGRVLTSGGAITALEGAERIGAMVARAAGRIDILPAGGIRASNVGALLARVSVVEVHASCRAAVDATADLVRLGFAGTTRQATDEREIRALRIALNAG